MAKRFVCKPAPEIEIETSGGEVILLRFDLFSVSNLQELSEGGLTEIMQKSLPELAACIVYASGKNHNENFAHEDARAIVASMSVEDIRAIIEEYSDAMGVEKNALQEDLAKKMMAQFLNGKT